ncbi:DUF1570 domain-containing protein [Pedobacter sp. P351]|uniref:DUF1570 domain-containing protein n=1 Tax=Pedobacter superstes TaxID=3133441 RepID=UPI0030B446B3
MKIKIQVIFLLLFSLVHLSTYSQIIQIEKINCRISQSDHDKIEKIARFEKDLYNNFFNTLGNDSLVIRVSILSAADYKEIQNKASGLHKTYGFYAPRLDQSFVLKNTVFLSTVIHEMSHCLLRHNLKSPPRWLNEGIAEFCGTMLIDDDKVSFSADPHRIKAVRDMVIKSPLRLKDLMNADDSEWRDLDKRSNLYSISYAMIYFLIKKNPSILKRMLLFMQEGQTPVDAIEFSYGGFYKFENEFNAFYKNTLIKPI